MKKRYFFFYIITIIILIFFIEIISFGLLKLNQSNNKNLFIDNFQVRDFTERTNDERLITMKKNFNKKEIDSVNEVKEKTWSIFTSNFRTRISETRFASGNKIDIEKTNKSKILFIGDSVPFGMGVDAESSLPFIFGNKNSKYLSINGAIPSYSLKQSVERFIIEFKKIKNLKYVYIQVYDPASQYAILGSKWNEIDNWTNRSDQVLRRYGSLKNLLDLKIPFYGKIYFFTVIKKLIVKIHGHKIFFSLPTEESDKRYILHIQSQLKKLLNHLETTNVKLIIAPITIPHIKLMNSDENIDYHLRAVGIFNKTLKKFSKNKNVHYIDTISILKEQYEKNFIDNCCHLSGSGAELVASNLSKILTNK
tara:strand:+ start:2012 stop:3106 length:1095 start_codon:yes stop_codon:yes gene_type:complete